MMPVEFITGLFGANLEADYGMRRYIPLYLILASIFALQAHKLLEEQFEPSLSKLRP